MNHHHGDLGISRRTPWMTRRMARLLLGEWGAPADMIEVAELLTSELATNAVRPDLGWPARGGYAPHITQWLWHVPDLVVMEISDRNKKPPELQVAEDESESGRGLQLVESMSREWGYYYGRNGWKTVYCVIGAIKRDDGIEGPP
jgi:hypothetical protein